MALQRSDLQGRPDVASSLPVIAAVVTLGLSVDGVVVVVDDSVTVPSTCSVDVVAAAAVLLTLAACGASPAHPDGHKKPSPAGPPPPDLADDEQRVYDLLVDGPLHIDAIIVQSGLGGGRAASVLVGLEMKGAIRQLRGKVFERADGG